MLRKYNKRKLQHNMHDLLYIICFRVKTMVTFLLAFIKILFWCFAMFTLSEFQYSTLFLLLTKFNFFQLQNRKISYKTLLLYHIFLLYIIKRKLYLYSL